MIATRNRRRLALSVSRDAARQVRVVAWAVLGIAALPFAAAGQCTDLTCDTAVNARIETASQVDCYTFTAGDGEIVDISVLGVDAAGLFQPAWRLLDHTGTPVNGLCGGFGPSEPNFPCEPLVAAGSPYRLEVEAAQPGDTGAYAARFERVTAAAACEDVPLTCGVPVAGTIDPPLDTDLLSFSVRDGDVVELSVVSGLHGGAVIDASWQLLDGTGHPVQGDCGVFALTESNYVCGPLAASGNPYRILVGDDDATNAGGYKVRFQPLTLDSACSSTALACGVAMTVAIEDPPPEQQCGSSACPVLDTKLFSFSIGDGEHIAVTVDRMSPFSDGFDAGWRLLDHAGNRVAGDCGDFAASDPNYDCGPLPSTGNPYQLEVGGIGEPVPGHVHVVVNTLTSACATECAGDCDGNQTVGINELLTLVNIALGNATTSACVTGDPNRDGMVGINELVAAVTKALNGCS